LGTASGRFGVPGPFDVLASSRKEFHAEGAERGAPAGHSPPRPAEARSRAHESLRRAIKSIWGRGWRGAVRWCTALDPESSPPRELFSATSARSA